MQYQKRPSIFERSNAVPRSEKSPSNLRDLAFLKSQMQYQGARKAPQIYVEIVGLQKLQIQGESLVPIGAKLLDFLVTASPCSHHPHQASFVLAARKQGAPLRSRLKV